MSHVGTAASGCPRSTAPIGCSFVDLRVLSGYRPWSFYFLNRFSNAARASFGRRLAGVEVSFSRVTRIS